MKKQILIAKNIANEGPGLIEEILNKVNVPYSLLDVHDETHFPPIEKLHALIVMGGPDSANDTTKKMLRELAYIREVISAGIPYLGICLGLQTLVKANGGKVIKSPLKETGVRDPQGNFFTATITKEGKDDPLFQGITPSFKVFHLHGEMVELTPSMKLLAIGNHCRNQIVKIGSNAFGMQCHLELTQDLFEFWLDEDCDLQKIPRNSLRKDF